MEIDLSKLFDSLEDSKSTRLMLSALKDNYQENFDYLKFKNAINELIKLGHEEDMALKSAFTTAQSLGISKQILVKSIRHYLNVLDNEKDKFADALKGQMDKNIATKKKELEYLEKKRLDKLQEIERLKGEVELIVGKIEENKVKIDVQEKKIGETKSEFMSAFSALKEEIQGDLSKVDTVL